jgi:hypothetical protein
MNMYIYIHTHLHIIIERERAELQFLRLRHFKNHVCTTGQGEGPLRIQESTAQVVSEARLSASSPLQLAEKPQKETCRL